MNQETKGFFFLSEHREDVKSGVQSPAGRRDPICCESLSEICGHKKAVRTQGPPSNLPHLSGDQEVPSCLRLEPQGHRCTLPRPPPGHARGGRGVLGQIPGSDLISEKCFWSQPKTPR